MSNITEQGNLRITTYGNRSIHIDNCELAGKRGKNCEQVSIQVWDRNLSGNNGQLFCDLVHNLEMKLEELTTWEQVIQYTEHAKALRSDANEVQIHFSTEKAIRVAPVGFKKISIITENFSFNCDWESFCASDLTDRANDPRWISSHRTKKADYKKLYTWAQANIERIKTIESMSKLTTAIQDEVGVSGHYYCAVD